MIYYRTQPTIKEIMPLTGAKGVWVDDPATKTLSYEPVACLALMEYEDTNHNARTGIWPVFALDSGLEPYNPFDPMDDNWVGIKLYEDKLEDWKEVIDDKCAELLNKQAVAKESKEEGLGE